MNFSIVLLHTIAFLDLFAVGLLVPLVAAHVRSLGGSHIYVGLLGSIYSGIQIGSGPLIGSLSDLKGRRTILILTALLCAGAYSVLGFTTSITIILVMRAFLGLVKQTQMLTKALVPDYEKDEENQAKIYGKMAAISGAGITLGPVLGGHISEDNPKNGFTYVAIIVGCCFVGTAGLAYLLPKTKKPVKRKTDDTQVSTHFIIHSFLNSMKQSVMLLYNIEWALYWEIFMFKALVGFAMGVYYSNYALFLKTEYELTPKFVGYVISFQGVVGSVSSFFIGYINNLYKHDKDYSLRNFHVFVMLNCSLIGIALTSNVYMYVVCLVPLAIGNAIGRLVTLEMLLKTSCVEHRGTLIGASNSVRSLSGVVAPMVAGFIAQAYGVSFVIYASLCSTTVGLLMSYHYRRKIKAD